MTQFDWMSTTNAGLTLNMDPALIRELGRAGTIPMVDQGTAEKPFYLVYMPDLIAYRDRLAEEEAKTRAQAAPPELNRRVGDQDLKTILKPLEDITLEERLRDYARERAFLREKIVEIQHQLDTKTRDNFPSWGDFDIWQTKAKSAHDHSKAQLARIDAFLHDQEHNAGVVLTLIYRIITLQEQLLELNRRTL